MALMSGVGLILLGVLTATLSRMLGEEFVAWRPSIIRSLIKFAVGRLPQNQRQRFEEEWQSHVNDVPGHFGKFLVALGFLTAACNIAVNDRRDRELKELLAQLDDMFSTSIAMVNVIENEKTLASREDLGSNANDIRSLLSEFQEWRNQLATVVAIASARPLVVNLSYTLIDSVLRRNIRRRNISDQISQTAKRICEKNALIVKRVEERARSRGR